MLMLEYTVMNKPFGRVFYKKSIMDEKGILELWAFLVNY